jgi:hypothetical protein
MGIPQLKTRSASTFHAHWAGVILLLAGCQPMAPLQVATHPPLFSAPPMASGPEADPGYAISGSNPISGQNGVMEGTVPAKVVHVPVANADVAWEKIVDVVDDYFRIEREQRVRLVGKVLTEGRIDTLPQTGASILEPHLSDSVGMASRLESTFQTIRRQAEVRVIPEASGYLVDIVVKKELEDLPRPEQATTGGTTFRHDTSMPSRQSESVSHTYYARQWISLGRDQALEQEMLSEIEACFGR